MFKRITVTFQNLEAIEIFSKFCTRMKKAAGPQVLEHCLRNPTLQKFLNEKGMFIQEEMIGE